MTILITALEDQIFALLVFEPVALDIRRTREPNLIVRTVVLLYQNVHLIRILEIDSRRIETKIHLLVTSVDLYIRMAIDVRLHLDSRFYHTTPDLSDLVLRITVLIHRQQIITTLGNHHLGVREGEPVMGIFAARIDGMLIVGDVLRSESAQILTGEDVALLGPIGVHVLHRKGIEMHVMTHLVERNMEHIFGIRPVQFVLHERQTRTRDAQRTHAFVIDMRVGLRAYPEHKG